MYDIDIRHLLSIDMKLAVKTGLSSHQKQERIQTYDLKTY